MRVAACIPTRGNVDLTEIIESIPEQWELIVWDNSQRENLSVYGRYAAIALTEAEIIYTQDDDCVLEPESFATLRDAYQPGVLTANMPEQFRHSFYQHHCLVGFGAIFHRDLPAEAFGRLNGQVNNFNDLCDVAFTGLSTRHLVDVPKRDLDWASAPDRMWKQKNHQSSRSLMLEIVRRVA